MEFETYGHVEAHVAVPTAGELEAREAEVRRQKEQRRLEAEDHQRREAAATKLQAHIRGRQARTSYHRSVGVTMTRSERDKAARAKEAKEAKAEAARREAAATRIQAVHRGRMSRKRGGRHDLREYRRQMLRMRHDAEKVHQLRETDAKVAAAKAKAEEDAAAEAAAAEAAAQAEWERTHPRVGVMHLESVDGDGGGAYEGMAKLSPTNAASPTNSLSPRELARLHDAGLLSDDVYAAELAACGPEPEPEPEPEESGETAAARVARERAERLAPELQQLHHS